VVAATTTRIIQFYILYYLNLSGQRRQTKDSFSKSHSINQEEWQMKPIVLTAGIVIMFLMLGAFSAQAAMVQSNIYDPIDNWTNPDDASDAGTKIKPSNLFGLYPELNFDLTLEGYTPGIGLTSATLLLDLADDAAYSSTAGAGVTIALQGGGSAMRQFVVQGDRDDYAIDISDKDILATLEASGSLNFTVGVSDAGDEQFGVDFVFYDAQMSAEAVPIPSALLLLGTGLLGLVGIRKRVNHQ
jgi:hypothetical protein